MNGHPSGGPAAGSGASVDPGPAGDRRGTQPVRAPARRRGRAGTAVTAADYQARLVEFAAAPSVAELQRIVTEIPAFGGRRPGAGPGRRRRPAPSRRATLDAPCGPADGP